MNKKYTIIITICIFIALGLGLGLIKYNNYENTKENKKEIQSVNKSIRPKKQKNGYYIKLDHGEVCIYDSNSTNLYERTGIYATNIQQEDVRKLKKGIYAKNQKELYSLLENLSS